MSWTQRWADGFESGNFTGGGWSETDTGNDLAISTTSPHGGTYCASYLADDATEEALVKMFTETLTPMRTDGWARILTSGDWAPDSGNDLGFHLCDFIAFNLTLAQIQFQWSGSALQYRLRAYNDANSAVTSSWYSAPTDEAWHKWSIEVFRASTADANDGVAVMYLDDSEIARLSTLDQYARWTQNGAGLDRVRYRSTAWPNPTGLNATWYLDDVTVSDYVSVTDKSGDDSGAGAEAVSGLSSSVGDTGTGGEAATVTRTYYVDPNGSDGAAGASAGTAWATLSKVNGTSIPASSTVLLVRDGVWRESLVPKAGVAYAAYGSGAKPSIRGSDTANTAGSWTQESALWYLSGITADPGVFVHDGTLGRRRTSKGALAQAWDYWWDDPNDRLYVHAAANPTTLATLLEYGARNRILSDYATVTGDSYTDLDVRHNQGDITWGSFGTTTSTFTRCDFTQLAGNGLQFHNGSGGSVTDCTFTDWGVTDGQFYAVHTIGYEAQDAAALDVDGCDFTITHSGNVTELSAVMSDQRGWLRTFTDCTCDGTAGNWARDAVTVWRPASVATSVEISGNTIRKPGGIGIALQELGYYSATGTAVVHDNVITDACAEDRADTEALRLRDWTAAGWTVTVHHNVVDSTLDGANDHHGIRVQAATGVLLYHNTVYGTDDGIRLDDDQTVRAPGATAKNNVASGCRAAPARVAAGSLTEDHNDWHGTAVGFTPAGTDLNADPLFVGADGGDFTLRMGSPARDVGTAIAGINDTYLGAGPDLGAVESAVLAGPLTIWRWD